MNFRRQAGLSKSLILKGMQCPKALYLTKNPPDFEFSLDPARDAGFQVAYSRDPINLFLSPPVK